MMRKSKYHFARSLAMIEWVAEEYNVQPETIEDTLDEFFKRQAEVHEKNIDGKRKLRVVKHEDLVILQLCQKRGRGFNCWSKPWFFIFKRIGCKETSEK